MGLYSIGRNKTKMSFNRAVFLLLAGQAHVCGHLSPTPLVAAYENHSGKRPALVRGDTYETFDCIVMGS